MPALPPAPDIAAWVTNVAASVSIVMVNKQVMGSKGCNFDFAVTLCAMHFTLTSIFSKALSRYRAATDKAKVEAKDTDSGSLSVVDTAIFVFVSNMSIVSLNTSLMINTVSLYQLAKLGIPPFSAAVEWLFFGKSFGMAQLAAMALTLVGVGLVSVAEFSVTGSVFGVSAAATSIAMSSMQQILCGHYQRKAQMTSNQFLGAVTPWQGLTLLVLGPPMDRKFMGRWVWDYGFTQKACLFIFLSCSMAVAVNASHFMCLGRFSPVSYQVMGHTKTVCVLAIGYFFFGGLMTQKQLCGTALCIVGMVSYAIAVAGARKPDAAPAPAARDESAEGLTDRPELAERGAKSPAPGLTQPPHAPHARSGGM